MRAVCNLFESITRKAFTVLENRNYEKAGTALLPKLSEKYPTFIVFTFTASCGIQLLVALDAAEAIAMKITHSSDHPLCFKDLEKY